LWQDFRRKTSAARLPPQDFHRKTSIARLPPADFRLPIFNLAAALSSVTPKAGNRFAAIRTYSRNRRDGVPQYFRRELFATTQLAEVPHAANVSIDEKNDGREA
jgi:hypothetical protein